MFQGAERNKGYNHLKSVDKEEWSSQMLAIQDLVDDIKCYETGRELRWSTEVSCPQCDSTQIKKRGNIPSKNIVNGSSAKRVNVSSMT